MSLESNIYVISAEKTFDGELEIVNQLFASGMKVFHLRKPGATEDEIKAFILGINPKYRSKIALHSHHYLSESLGVCRIHLKESDRGQFKRNEGYVYSTSFHSISNALEKSSEYDYYFLSPVFESISKVGYMGKRFKAPTKNAVALGGVEESKLDEVTGLGYDAVAVLGALWTRVDEAIEKFIKIKKHYEKAICS